MKGTWLGFLLCGAIPAIMFLIVYRLIDGNELPIFPDDKKKDKKK